MPLGPTPISTNKNVPVTLWPDAPDPRTQSRYGAAGLNGAMSSIGRDERGGRVGKLFGDPWGDGRNDMYRQIYDSWGGWGGGGGCPRSGAPVKLYGDPTWWTKTTLPNRYFRRFTTSTGRTGEFSLSDERYTERGLIKCADWVIGDKLLTEDGEEAITQLELVDDPDGQVDFYHATQGHIYSAYGVIGHNKDNPFDSTI